MVQIDNVSFNVDVMWMYIVDVSLNVSLCTYIHTSLNVVRNSLILRCRS